MEVKAIFMQTFTAAYPGIWTGIACELDKKSLAP